MTGNFKRNPNSFADACGDGRAIIGVFNVGDDDGKFVGAESRDEIVVGDAVAQAVADRAQQLVADRMPQGIVQRHEMIEIEMEHCQRPAFVRMRERMRQPFA